MVYKLRHDRFSWKITIFFCLFVSICNNAYAQDLTVSDRPTAERRYSFSNIVEKILPATARIDIQKRIRHHNDNFLAVNRNAVKEPKISLQKMSSGAGIIISPDGYIITNSHLVQDALKIDVTLYDKRHFAAKVVGRDGLTEVAVIKIDADKLDFARLGDSGACRVGDWVLAVGNPLNLKFTVTSGIISALGREIDIINNSYAIEAFIQTDAAINPGNSGGPLVNMNGEIIGINTAIATENGLNMGFGFAVPANLVRKISSELITSGKVERAYLGAAFLDVNADIAAAIGMTEIAGVFVDDVFTDSPAQQFGLKPMDVILSINGQKLNRANQLQFFIAK